MLQGYIRMPGMGNWLWIVRLIHCLANQHSSPKPCGICGKLPILSQYQITLPSHTTVANMTLSPLYQQCTTLTPHPQKQSHRQPALESQSNGLAPETPHCSEGPTQLFSSGLIQPTHVSAPPQPHSIMVAMIIYLLLDQHPSTMALAAMDLPLPAY